MSIWKRKNVFVMSGLFFLIGTLCLAFLCVNNSRNDTKLDKVILKSNNITDKSTFAIMIQKEDGSGYEEINTFPTEGNLNMELSGCIDADGNLIKNALTYSGGIVNAVVDSTAYCYLYFDGVKDDVTITVTTDGVSNEIPTSGIYKVSTSCSSGNAYYNPYYQRLEIGGFKRRTKCTLDYTKDTTSYTLLSNIVQSANSTNNNGYRYSGKTPNNYIWFNNELWRIIGLVPACTTASSGTCSIRTNLVKIIRAESIGGLAYDAKSSETTGLWGSNTLYTLLNTYYYGKQNGTGTAYCYGYQAISVADCDYTNIGISSSSTDYYGRMVKSVYWNIGASTSAATPGTIYGTETAKVTTNQAKIGLMSASDYGYAAVISGYSSSLSSYGTAAVTGTNWLYSQGDEWTNIQCSDVTPSYTLYVYEPGDVRLSMVYYGYAVRPVLYLDAGVYVISGSGTMLNPYMIGM